ncbi:TonB-dependent Receptor Plug Domain [Sphingobium faniae]|nr:TonB-dependent Receptor Plug Domain [Sphingobium faniae]
MSSDIRLKLLCCVSPLLFMGIGAGTALAQSSPEGPVENNDAAPAADMDLAEDIIVSGSRIVRDGYTAPTPVTIARTEDLVKATPTNLPDALNKLPQFQLSSSPARSTHNQANNPSHGNILNLRGIGGNRTLILFDGLRVPPTTYRGDVDTNIIPNLLIERVEVVTAGASAAYGSDAVSGVVNFILNRKFEGLTANAQYGLATRGDNQNYRLGIAGGTSLFDGKGHLLLSAELFDSKGMKRNDRPQAGKNYIFAGKVPGAANPGSATNPFVLYENGTNALTTEGGLITSGPYSGYRFLPDGQLAPFDPGTLTGTPNYNVGGDGFRIPLNATAVAPLRTQQYFGRFSYDVADDVNFYVQGGFTRSDLQYQGLANTIVPPSPAVIFSGNPWLPTELQAAMTANGVDSFNMTTSLGLEGPLPVEERTDFIMASTGLEGQFGGGWNWQIGYNYGRSKHSVALQGAFDLRKRAAALDAVDDGTGRIVCNASLSADAAIRQRYADCSPLNIFGVNGPGSTPAGLAYATDTSTYRAIISQHAVSGSIQGDLIDLPAGPVTIAVGGEYRSQKLDLTSNSDPALLDTATEKADFFAGLRGVSPTALRFFLLNTGVASGKSTVKEGFVEIAVPVLKDAPFFRALDINAAGRVTDYSTSGTVKTWKLGATWKPVDDLLLRVTRSRDIRAPTLFDLFAGAQSNIGAITDPVSGLTQSVQQTGGGNPNLKPEEADTLTFGGVLSPSFLPGFSVSVDYYRLKIDGAIGTLTARQIIENCAANPATPECGLIIRPSANAFPTNINIVPANIAFLKTSGIDIDASYRRPLGNGQLGLRLYANYLDSFVTQQSSTAPAYDLAGTAEIGPQPIGRPRWRGTFNVNYTQGNFGLFLSEQFIGKFRLGSDQPNQVFDYPAFKPVWYTDLTLSYKVPARGGTLELFTTVNNLFDKDPPIAPGTNPGLNFPTVISVYDIVGRTMTVGAKFRF